ncbi:721_t:CDS:2 [Gigaspora rosea]|nr:721_t:CDS:2 [Gigaspora rosea]
MPIRISTNISTVVFTNLFGGDIRSENNDDDVGENGDNGDNVGDDNVGDDNVEDDNVGYDNVGDGNVGDGVDDGVDNVGDGVDNGVDSVGDVGAALYATVAGFWSRMATAFFFGIPALIAGQVCLRFKVCNRDVWD